ncbi:hypothetical protein [Actinomycetospora aeridis]|uniref:Uncharacterized protein n=1 Tax=Actinomycetospora aeridis TaxID=3129231 RepID=A0ABU8N3W0_9PSEU
MPGGGRDARDLPAPTSTSGGWATWRGDGWTVLANCGGITVHAPANLTAAGARDLADALEAAAQAPGQSLRVVPEPRGGTA